MSPHDIWIVLKTRIEKNRELTILREDLYH